MIANRCYKPIVYGHFTLKTHVRYNNTNYSLDKQSTKRKVYRMQARKVQARHADHSLSCPRSELMHTLFQRTENALTEIRGRIL